MSSSESYLSYWGFQAFRVKPLGDGYDEKINKKINKKTYKVQNKTKLS